jgi:hypothetical protein
LKISPSGRNDKNVDSIIFDRGSIKGIETSPSKKVGGYGSRSHGWFNPVYKQEAPE